MQDIISVFNSNIDAITGFGIFFTLLASIASLFFSIQNNKAIHYVNSVTKSRIEWIQKLRVLTSKFIASTNIYKNYHYEGDDEKSGIHLSHCQQLCTELTLLLNSCDERDREIISICNEILDNYHRLVELAHNLKHDDKGNFIETPEVKNYIQEINKKIDQLTKKIQIYLKAEWNRVKYESQGKIYFKEIQDFDYKELEEIQKNTNYKKKKFKRFYKNVWINVRNFISSPSVIMIVGVLIVLFVVLKAFKSI